MAESRIARIKRRNFLYGQLNGLLYSTGETLFDPTLVVVTFLGFLTDSPLLLGLLVPIRDATWSLPQLWMSGIVQNEKRKVRLYRIAAVLRTLSWALIVFCIWFINDPKLLLITFFVIYSISNLMNGLGGLPFMEMVGKTIEPSQRAEFFAWRNGLGGVGGIAASFVVRAILSEQSGFVFPENYAILALLFMIFAAAGLFIFALVDEIEDSPVIPRKPFGVQFRQAISVMRQDGNYRNFFVMRSLQILSGSAVPFFAIYLQRQFGVATSFVGIYLAFFTASNLLANYLFGRVSRRDGSKKVIVTATFASMSMLIYVLALVFFLPTMSFTPDLAGWLLTPAFILNGFRMTGFNIAGNSLMLDLSPPAQRAVYIGFSNTILGIVLLATGISGIIMTVMGFQGLLWLTMALNLIAVYLVLRLDTRMV